MVAPWTPYDGKPGTDGGCKGNLPRQMFCGDRAEGGRSGGGRRSPGSYFGSLRGIRRRGICCGIRVGRVWVAGGGRGGGAGSVGEQGSPSPIPSSPCTVPFPACAAPRPPHLVRGADCGASGDVLGQRQRFFSLARLRAPSAPARSVFAFSGLHNSLVYRPRSAACSAERSVAERSAMREDSGPINPELCKRAVSVGPGRVSAPLHDQGQPTFTARPENALENPELRRAARGGTSVRSAHRLRVLSWFFPSRLATWGEGPHGAHACADGGALPAEILRSWLGKASHLVGCAVAMAV